MPSVEIRCAVEAPFRPAAMRRFAERTLKFHPAFRNIQAVSIATVGSARMARLNRRLRGKRGPTNVLSFTYPLPQANAGQQLCEILLCPPVIRREARARGLPLQRYAALLILHGLLHAAGFDHRRRAARARMEQLEDTLLAKGHL